MNFLVVISVATAAAGVGTADIPAINILLIIIISIPASIFSTSSKRTAAAAPFS